MRTKIITPREFRANLKQYFELSEQERVIIHRGKKGKSVLLMPIDDDDETDIYFSDPQVIEKINKGIQEIKDGKGRRVSMDDIRELLGLNA
jgi:Phd_YefM.